MAVACKLFHKKSLIFFVVAHLHGRWLHAFLSTYIHTTCLLALYFFNAFYFFIFFWIFCCWFFAFFLFLYIPVMHRFPWDFSILNGGRRCSRTCRRRGAAPLQKNDAANMLIVNEQRRKKENQIKITKIIRAKN